MLVRVPPPVRAGVPTSGIVLLNTYQLRKAEEMRTTMAVPHRLIQAWRARRAYRAAVKAAARELWVYDQVYTALMQEGV